jgi:hypothetical protein
MPLVWAGSIVIRDQSYKPLLVCNLQVGIIS